MRGRATSFAALALLVCSVSALRPSAAEVKALEPAPEAEPEAPAPCANGLVINGKCECKDGWTGAECDMAVDEAPPQYDGKLEPTRDFYFTADDRWICPGGCSTHGDCNEETRECACSDDWTGDACQRTEFMAERSDPALEQADELPLEAHVLLPEAEVPEQAERLLKYLVEMRTRIKVLQDQVGSKEDAEDRVALEEDKEELVQTNATLHEFGGYRRLAQEREDYRAAQLEDMKEHYDDLVAKANEKERHQVVEDALEDTLRRTIVNANSQGPEVKLGEFALFHAKAKSAAMDEGAAKKVVRDIDIGEPFEHEVERHTMSEHTVNNFVVPK